MSEAQRCANVMRRYGMTHRHGTIKRGCYDSTVKELERQELRIAELSQRLEDAGKDVERYRAHIQESADRADRAIASLNLPEGSYKKELLQVLRDFHLSVIAASKPATTSTAAST